MRASVLLCLVASTKTALCAWPFGSDFAYWFWQSCKICSFLKEPWKISGLHADSKPAVVVDQWLYIDGGEYYLLDNGFMSVIDSKSKTAKRVPIPCH